MEIKTLEDLEKLEALPTKFKLRRTVPPSLELTVNNYVDDEVVTIVVTPRCGLQVITGGMNISGVLPIGADLGFNLNIKTEKRET